MIKSNPGMEVWKSGDSLMRLRAVRFLLLLVAGIVVCVISAIYITMWSHGTLNWSENRIAESKNIGNRIIIGIYKYKIKYQRYPSNLEELIPEFVDRIDMPTAGNRRWYYEASEGDFHLQFCCDSEYPSCSFFSTAITWHEDN